MNDETFHANRPFLFYIEDENSGAILYMGVVNNPQEETGIAVPASPHQAPSRMGEQEGECQKSPYYIAVSERDKGKGKPID